MEFEPQDDDAYDADRTQLSTRFRAWLTASSHGSAHFPTDTDDAVSDVEMALDWKRNYGDSRLTRWTPADVEEFLLGWCPRKLSASAEGAASIPDSIARFVEFLAHERLLSGGAAPPELARFARALAGRFRTEMSNPANFGLAKSMFAGANTDGVDVTDPDSLERWVEEFNARSFEERTELLGPSSYAAAPPRTVLPAIVLPSETALAESRAAAPILEKFTVLADFVGAGRKLTGTGNITLADARRLVALLGTPDRVDTVIGDRTFRTRSAADLPWLHLILAWARKAGVVRVRHGRLIATKKHAARSNDTAAVFDAAVEALVELGPLSRMEGDTERAGAWPDLDEFVDSMLILVLAGPFVANAAVPLAQIADRTTDVVMDSFSGPATQDWVSVAVRHRVLRLVDVLALAGLVVRVDVAEPDDAWSLEDSGTVELTAAGIVATHQLMLDAGYDVPVAVDLSSISAVALLGTDDAEDAQIDGWLRGRDPETRGAELAAAASQVPAEQQVRATVLLVGLGPDAAEPWLRSLLADPMTTAMARCGLVEG